MRAGFESLTAGGWYFEAGWEPGRHGTPPTEWAAQHGYESAECHQWRYPRARTGEEYAAAMVELTPLASGGAKLPGRA